MERISKYLDDTSFVCWVLNPTTELDQKWKSYLTSHPNESAKLSLAQKVLLKFKTVDKNMSEQERIVLFSKIIASVERGQESRDKIRFLIPLSKYAAIAIIFFAIGALMFYQQDLSNQFILNSAKQVSYNESTVLIRPNGENIRISENKSTITYQKDQSKVIINDSIEYDQISKQDESELNQLNVPFGKTSIVRLIDGTIVHLNAGSRLFYPDKFDTKKREVYLDGEAFFEVAKDPAHPFFVQTSDIHVEVKGTKFNLCAYETDKAYETVLTEGKVRVMKNQHGIFDEGVDIVPNQLATFDRYNGDIEVRKVDVDNYVLWTEGMFKFESSDLSWVTRKLERYYNISFIFSYANTRNLKISGKIQLTDSNEDVVSILENTTGLNIIKRGDRTYVIN